MNKFQKNLYEVNTPEWQLFENVQSAQLAAVAYDADVQRYSL